MKIAFSSLGADQCNGPFIFLTGTTSGGEQVTLSGDPNQGLGLPFTQTSYTYNISMNGHSLGFNLRSTPSTTLPAEVPSTIPVPVVCGGTVP